MSRSPRPPSSPPPVLRRSLPEGESPAEVSSIIGPKPIEEFSDEEIETLEVTAIETPMRVVAAGGVLAVITTVPLSSGPSTHIMWPNPLD